MRFLRRTRGRRHNCKYHLGQFVWAQVLGDYEMGRVRAQRKGELYLIDPIGDRSPFWAYEWNIEFATDGDLMLTDWGRGVPPNHA